MIHRDDYRTRFYALVNAVMDKASTQTHSVNALFAMVRDALSPDGQPEEPIVIYDPTGVEPPVVVPVREEITKPTQWAESRWVKVRPDSTNTEIQISSAGLMLPVCRVLLDGKTIWERPEEEACR